MDLDINLNEISYDELIAIYNKAKDFISFLSNEIETSEVEKKTKWVKPMMQKIKLIIK